MDASPHYSAFISYSHVDIKIVTKIHQRLEDYMIPESIRKQYQEKKLASHLSRVFLDTMDLNLGPIRENLKEALKNSDNLIIFGSDASSESRWVREEIKLFKETHPNYKNHIIPISLISKNEKPTGIELYPDDLEEEIFKIDIDKLDNHWNQIIAKLSGINTGDLSRCTKRNTKNLWSNKNLAIFFIL